MVIGKGVCDEQIVAVPNHAPVCRSVLAVILISTGSGRSSLRLPLKDAVDHDKEIAHGQAAHEDAGHQNWVPFRISFRLRGAVEDKSFHCQGA
jgi:hypothetical protein